MNTSKIIIELEDASWQDVDVIKMTLREQIEKYVAEYNTLNQSNISVKNISFDHPALHKQVHSNVPLKLQLEKRSNELYPENIIKKKDKSKPLKAAYVQGGLDTRDILAKAYADGVPAEELLNEESDV